MAQLERIAEEEPPAPESASVHSFDVDPDMWEINSMDGGNSLSVDGGNSLSSMVAHDDHDDFANDDSCLDENIEPLSLDLSSLIADKGPSKKLSKELPNYSENPAHAAAGLQTPTQVSSKECPSYSKIPARAAGLQTNAEGSDQNYLSQCDNGHSAAGLQTYANGSDQKLSQCNTSSLQYVLPPSNISQTANFAGQGGTQDTLRFQENSHQNLYPPMNYGMNSSMPSRPADMVHSHGDMLHNTHNTQAFVHNSQMQTRMSEDLLQERMRLFESLNGKRNANANMNTNSTNMYAGPSVASSNLNELAENNQLRHYAYSTANADMKQQYAAVSVPDMCRKRNGTSDDGTRSYANDRYFPQGVQSTSFNEYEPLSFTNPRRTVARRLSTASVATSSVHDHIAHSIGTSSVHDQAIDHSIASSSAHELCHNTAALTFYQGVRKTVSTLPVYNHYGMAMSNANVARSDYSNHSDSHSNFSYGTSVHSFAALSVNSFVGAQPDELQSGYGSGYGGNTPVADYARSDAKAGKAKIEDHPIVDYGDYLGQPVVEIADQQHATKFSFAVLSEVECCEFGKKDVTGKRVGLPDGFKGLACRHCKGSRRLGGRLFPSKIKTMADTNKTLMPLYKHMMKCTAVSATTKARLEVCKAEHENERKTQKKYGSQKAFFSSIWERLHGTGNDK